MTTAPPQHLVALERAQTIRLTRSERRRRIAALPPAEGRQAVGILLLEVPDYIATARVLDVLRWPARSGEHAALTLMAAEHIGAGREVEDLTRRQRVELAARLGVPATPALESAVAA